MIMHGSNIEMAWKNLIDVFGELITVRRLELGPCPASVVENAVNSFWRLERLSAQCILPMVAQRPAEYVLFVTLMWMGSLSSLCKAVSCIVSVSYRERDSV